FPGWEFLWPQVESFGAALLDLAPRAVVLLDEPPSLREEAGKLWQRWEEEYAAARAAGRAAAAPGELFLRWTAFEARAAAAPRLGVQQLALENAGAEHFATASQLCAAFRG